MRVQTLRKTLREEHGHQRFQTRFRPKLQPTSCLLWPRGLTCQPLLAANICHTARELAGSHGLKTGWLLVTLVAEQDSKAPCANSTVLQCNSLAMTMMLIINDDGDGNNIINKSRAIKLKDEEGKCH